MRQSLRISHRYRRYSSKNQAKEKERDRKPCIHVHTIEFHTHTARIFVARCLIKIKFNCALNQTTSSCLPITCRQNMVIGRRWAFFRISFDSGDIYLLQYVAYFVICTCNTKRVSTNMEKWSFHTETIDYNCNGQENPIELTINFYLYWSTYRQFISWSRLHSQWGSPSKHFIKYDWHRIQRRDTETNERWTLKPILPKGEFMPQTNLKWPTRLLDILLTQRINCHSCITAVDTLEVAR